MTDDRAWMTPLLREIAEIAGDEAAIALGREKACRRVHIPETVPEGHWLTMLCGQAAASAIADRYGGTDLFIAPALGGRQRFVSETIATMTDNGFTIDDIAHTLGIARSTVIDHRAKLRAARDSRQGDLFAKLSD